ncbi:pectin acetylesterase 11-like [Capsicum galapagoense]
MMPFVHDLHVLVFVCRRMTTFMLALLACLAVFCTTHVLGAKDDLYINRTILESATAQGAVCLDGSPPSYHLDRGHGTGLRSWIIYLDGGGWCDSIPDCLNRSTMFLGSTKKMGQKGLFAGILHNTSQQNPEFYNWNRVRVKYYDGSSFTSDVEQVDSDNKLYFRGARIFKAVMEDLWSKGMKNAENAILSGISAGGLATILNCDKFKCLIPENARVKCIADAGFFINGKTIYGTSYIQEMYRRIVNLHGSAKNLPLSCTASMEPSLCFFPQNVVSFVQTPLFIINSIYDYWQINNTLIPPYLDPQHAWKDCICHINNCTFGQRIVIQAFGVEFLKTFEELPPSLTRGYFLTSCYSHGGILSPAYWSNNARPLTLLNKTINEAVADWYFEREGFQYIDPHPYVRDCKLVKLCNE